MRERMGRVNERDEEEREVRIKKKKINKSKLATIFLNDIINFKFHNHSQPQFNNLVF